MMGWQLVPLPGSRGFGSRTLFERAMPEEGVFLVMLILVLSDGRKFLLLLRFDVMLRLVGTVERLVDVLNPFAVGADKPLMV